MSLTSVGDIRSRRREVGGPMDGPLAGLRVVDVTQVLSGPYCTMLLADLDAYVVKVEPPTGDVARLWGPLVPAPRDDAAAPDSVASATARADRYGGYFASVNRNKRSKGGVMGVTGQDADHPVKVGPGVGDIFPAVLAVVGVRTAVRVAGTTGKGRLVDVAMYDSVLALTERIVYQHSLRGTSPAPQGNTHPLLCPYGVVRAADGFITVAAPSDHHWRLLAEIMGRPDLGVDNGFVSHEDRLAYAGDVYAEIGAWSLTLTTDEVVARLGRRIPCGPVNTAADIGRDSRVAARGMIVEVDHPSGGTVEIAGSPVKLTGTPPRRSTRAPTLGEHTDEILAHGFVGSRSGAAHDDEKQVG